MENQNPAKPKMGCGAIFGYGLAIVLVFGLIGKMCGPDTPDAPPDPKDKVFSAWDGSNRALVEWTKENMNDPASFEHVETRFIQNDSLRTFTVFMKFRGKNAFGGVIPNNVMGQVDYEGELVGTPIWDQ